MDPRLAEDSRSAAVRLTNRSALSGGQPSFDDISSRRNVSCDERQRHGAVGSVTLS